MNRFLGGVAVALGVASIARAAELHVPQEFSTVQGAVDAAASGDVIVLAPGSYLESVHVDGKSLTIRGAASWLTVWAAPKGQKALWTSARSSDSLTITDIGFTGGAVDTNGSAVDLEGIGSKTVSRCRFFSNAGRAALEVFGSGSVIEDCLFDRNQVGASVAWGQSMSIRRSTFFENDQNGVGSGGPWVPADLDIYACTMVADGCTFLRSLSAGGAPVRCVADATFIACDFEAGAGAVASGVQSYNQSSVARFSGCRFCSCPEPRFGGSGQFVDQGGNTIASECGAIELRVPGCFPTIQLAIDLASSGDVVRIASGEYSESCIVQGKAIALRGASNGSTTWRAPKGAACLVVPDSESVSIELSDLRVTGGALAYGNAVVSLLGSGAKEVRRCVFADNAGWAALSIFGDASLVDHCRFERNSVGLSIAWGQGMTVRGCAFVDNHQADPNGAGGGPWVPSDLDAYACSMSVQESEFNNGSSVGGAPIRVYAIADFVQCAFRSGRGGTASAVQAYDQVAVVRVADSSYCDSPEPRLAGSAQFVDLGGNTVFAFCEAPCPADLVVDHIINAADMAIVLNFWGTNGTQFPGVDINGDGVVNGADLAAVLNAWGPCPQ